MPSSMQYIAALSLVGCAIPKLLYLEYSARDTIKLFLLLSFAQTLLRAIWLIFIYPHFFSPLRHLPTPGGGHWLLGYELRSREVGVGILARKWSAEMKHNGFIRMLNFLNFESVLIFSSQALSEVLTTKSYTFEKPIFARNFLAFIIGWNLVTLEDEEHKTQRRNLMPAFSFRRIKDLYPTFWEKSREGALAITEQCHDGGYAEIEIGSWASRCTLDIIGVAGIGRDFGAIRDENNPLVKTYHNLKPAPEDAYLLALWSILPAWIMRILPTARQRTIAKSTQEIRNVCADLVREKKIKLANKESAGLDILTVALSSGMFTDEGLVDMMLAFLAAGHDTTASALTWAIYALCRYPHIQERLRAEVRANLPPLNDDRPVTSAEIDSLPYLNAVCNEVLRIYAPVPQSRRVATQDTTIQDQVIPKGTVIILAPWATNVDPQHWGPDAHEFKPERWMTLEQGGTSSSRTAASGGATTNYAFMTFLHGPRSCIGQSFSKSEFMCLVAAFVGRFSFELQDASLLDERNMKVYPYVVIKPRGGLHVRVRPIEGF